MYQPEPTAYLQVSTGYAIPHSLPDYRFDETPLRLSDGRGSAGPGASGNAASALLYGTPLFSTNSAGVGPAPSASGGSFNFHSTSSPSSTTTAAAAAASTITAPSHHRPSLPILLKMEPNTDDLVAQEAAAREYQPHLEGPLVGKKTPSTAIMEQYAKADAIYVQKTMVLPQTYSHYRPIQGDGNCGWRAIGFGYFETLVKSGSKARIQAEEQRLQELNGLLESVGGFSPYVFEDFVDETIVLLRKMADLAGHQEQAMTELREAFNTPSSSDSIMYHFRMLASSYLKGHRETYSAFVTSGTGVDGYCQEVLERHNIEIDHLGLILLANVLLKDAGFVLEVAYLDRSPGSQVNTYRIPEEANGRHPSELGPIIHLLYRPDHYDILYVPEPVDLQVHRVASFSQSYEVESAPMALHNFGSVDMHTLSLIPGFGNPAPGLAPMLDTTPSPLTTYSPSPVSPWVSSPYVDAIQQASPAPLPAPTPAPAPQTHPLRFSEYCQLPEYVDNNTWREQTLQTTTFKNSHFNVAHYNNPNFQPEEYKPGTDDSEAPPRASGRKRGSV
ncbi:peptidase C65 Otubain-domain-containing protein [Chaetomium fimeti]|jgi:ubiquitin thioesterase protein OTUB1|uniref:ubiquitinyl hydrolase 1 n=1 Tax=Chaetomium fimeti TaxID=1854472 RepID=A0AAE0LV37_9PEZI|nr:peptidase C65 Otubain-domain-containing protein [Chaetomium fimeti]